MERVRVGLVGCGGWQVAHAQRLCKIAEAEIVALCDVSEEHTRSLVERGLGDPKPPPPFFEDAARMYEQVELDAVFIATPHTMHYEHCVAALEAGCHIFCEKPMVTRAEDAYALAEEVEKSGKILVVGYNTPCSPEFAYLRDVIRNETLGRLELVIGHLTQNWMRGTTGSWRQDPALSGGGQAYDSGAHLLNSLVWSVEADIAEVHALVDNHGTPVDINSTINIRFENGTFAAIAVSGNCPTNGAHMAFIFDRGKIEIDPWAGNWIDVYEGSVKVKYPPITGASQYPDDNFIDAVLGRAEPRTSPRNGIVQSELMDAIYESARTGQPAKPERR